jgi:hypothetical protein
MWACVFSAWIPQYLDTLVHDRLICCLCKYMDKSSDTRMHGCISIREHVGKLMQAGKPGHTETHLDGLMDCYTPHSPHSPPLPCCGQISALSSGASCVEIRARARTTSGRTQTRRNLLQHRHLPRVTRQTLAYCAVRWEVCRKRIPAWQSKWCSTRLLRQSSEASQQPSRNE